MAEEQKMPNIDISEFTVSAGLSGNDYVVVSTEGGMAARVSVSLFERLLVRTSAPYIEDGKWKIGETDTGVMAEGKTPEFRRGELGVEYKYSGEDDTQWKLLIGIDELVMKFEDLNDNIMLGELTSNPADILE